MKESCSSPLGTEMDDAIRLALVILPVPSQALDQPELTRFSMIFLMIVAPRLRKLLESVPIDSSCDPPLHVTILGRRVPIGLSRSLSARLRLYKALLSSPLLSIEDEEKLKRKLLCYTSLMDIVSV